MAYQLDLPFNQKESTLIHLDLNSCFATIEQQANPLLRGKPIAVAAYTTSSGCILAPSVEAKKMGVRVGMRVRDGFLVCPGLQILSPDPSKYRNVHLKLKSLLSEYTDNIVPKSIDEFVLNFEGYPSFKRGLFEVGQEIKHRLRTEIGDWLTVSIGIGPNRFLAKMASNLKKPDGLEEINHQNYREIYSRLVLPDLHGIKKANTARLNSLGIYTVMDFYNSCVPNLKSAFNSILGYYWYLRLRGWEIDDVHFKRKSFGAMYSLPKPLVSPQDLAPILHKLVDKTTIRLRRSGFKARGVHLAILYRDHSFWHHGVSKQDYLFDTRDFYKIAYRIMISSPYSKPVANLAVSVFGLEKSSVLQLDLFNLTLKKSRLTTAVDSIKEKWGEFIITPAMMLPAKDLVPDRVGFGNVGDLENFLLSRGLGD